MKKARIMFAAISYMMFAIPVAILIVLYTELKPTIECIYLRICEELSSAKELLTEIWKEANDGG